MGASEYVTMFFSSHEWFGDILHGGWSALVCDGLQREDRVVSQALCVISPVSGKS